MKIISKKTARVNVRIPKELYLKMEEVANETSRSISDMARTCFEICINNKLIGEYKKSYCHYCEYYQEYSDAYGGACWHDENKGSCKGAYKAIWPYPQ